MSSKAQGESSSSSDDDDENSEETGIYVTELGPADVLLGRGTGPSMNEGNVTFRQTVEELKPSYVSTPSRKEKKAIVRKAVNGIKAKNGRFLTRLSKGEIKLLGLKEKVVFKVVPDSVAIEKTKQAIRYVHYKKDPSQVKKSPLDRKAARKRSMPQAGRESASSSVNSQFAREQAIHMYQQALAAGTPQSNVASLAVGAVGGQQEQLSQAPSPTLLGASSFPSQAAPAQRNEAIDGLIVLQNQLNNILAAGSTAAGYTGGALPGTLPWGIMPTTLPQASLHPASLLLSRGDVNANSFLRANQFQLAAANSANALLPYLAAGSAGSSSSNNNTSSVATPTSGCDTAASGTDPTSGSGASTTSTTEAEEKQVRAMLQANDQKRRLLESYLASLPHKAPPKR